MLAAALQAEKGAIRDAGPLRVLGVAVHAHLERQGGMERSADGMQGCWRGGSNARHGAPCCPAWPAAPAAPAAPRETPWLRKSYCRPARSRWPRPSTAFGCTTAAAGERAARPASNTSLSLQPIRGVRGKQGGSGGSTGRVPLLRTTSAAAAANAGAAMQALHSSALLIARLCANWPLLMTPAALHARAHAHLTHPPAARRHCLTRACAVLLPSLMQVSTRRQGAAVPD